MKFISKKYKALQLVLQPTTKRYVGLKWQIVPGTRVVFENGVYETEDKEIIEALKSHRLYGVQFYTDEPKADEPNREGAKEENAKKAVAEEIASVCPVCGFEAKSEFGLRAHMRKHEN